MGMWATYGLHAPFARVGNDLCYTIDQSLCGGKLGDGVCFLSAPVKSVSDSMDKELDKTLGSVRNVTAQFGYTFTGKATDTAEVTVAALKAVDTPMEADLKLFNTPAMKDKFYCTDLTGNCRANNLAQCQKELHPKISCNTGAAPCVPFVETPGATKPNHSLYKICDALILFESATVIGHFTDIGKWTNMITVMYGVIADLAPWGKCDYVVDIFSVMKTLLCDKMVRGIDYIQVSGLLQGIFLIPFVIITTGGWKKWGKDSNAAAVTPA